MDLSGSLMVYMYSDQLMLGSNVCFGMIYELKICFCCAARAQDKEQWDCPALLSLQRDASTSHGHIFPYIAHVQRTIAWESVVVKSCKTVHQSQTLKSSHCFMDVTTLHRMLRPCRCDGPRRMHVAHAQAARHPLLSAPPPISMGSNGASTSGRTSSPTSNTYSTHPCPSIGDIIDSRSRVVMHASEVRHSC